MDRREFLKSAAIAGAAATIKLNARAQDAAPAEDAAKAVAADESAAPAPVVVAVRNGEPAEMFRKGIEELGGMKAFVKPGQKVTVKPNIGWDRTPEQGANTDPTLVAEIVRQAIAAGAASVTVFDRTCNEWTRCYKNSGIEDAAKEAGAQVVPGNDENPWYVDRTCDQAVKMKSAKVHKALLEADVVINVPVLKNHGGAKMTAAMKNWMGVVWDRQFMHRNDLPQCIADSILYRKPDLNVIDAYRVMTANGPRGAVEADVSVRKYQILSRDIVAADTMALKVIGYELSQVPYLKMGEKHGLGSADESKFDIKRIEA
ncbi:MAG: DUF362 domain-containing protein [Kiritimatiellaeota bacterium]|nr:DUF362 domain-containing protein [Kiritimatiellota bacterium]